MKHALFKLDSRSRSADGRRSSGPAPSFPRDVRHGPNVTYRGVVKEYRWQNPHSYIVITVGNEANDPATVGTWDIEASSISLMLTRGWTPQTYKPGDPITVVGHLTTKDSRLVLLFYAIQSDGTRLYRAQHRYPLEVE